MGKGYGHLWIKGVLRGAHCLAYELHYGELPDGLSVLHHCDNPPCINPKHLYAGTYQDNARDRERRGRGNHPWGENHTRAKVTEDQVRAIRLERVRDGTTYQALGEKYGLCFSAIHRIIVRQTWTKLAETEKDLAARA